MKLVDKIELGNKTKIDRTIEDLFLKYKWLDYALAPVIVIIILCVVFAIKGVFPFGKNTIAYYDMSTLYVPFYSTAWDVYHGQGSIMLDWFSGLGTSSIGSVGTYILFPTNVFLLFTSRNGIIYAMSILLIIKMSLSALAMSFYCKKTINIPVWTVCAGILYACCGYVIQYYSNIFFLDFVILFPLLIYAFERLLYQNKCSHFIIIFSLCIISSYSLTVMVIFYLLFKGYLIIDRIPMEKRGRSIALFAFSGIVSVMITGIILLPSLLSIIGISRVDSTGFNYYTIIETIYNKFRYEKHLIMYGSEIAGALLGIVLLRGRMSIQKYRDNLIMMFILSIPILHEGINLLWHLGTYKHFPMRFGYMLTFECLIFVGRFFKEDDLKSIRYLGRIAKLFGLASIPFLAYVLFAFFKQFTIKALTDIAPFKSYWIYLITLICVYFIIFLADSKPAREIMLCMLVLIQAGCGCYGLIAPEIGFDNGIRIKYLKKALESRTYFNETIEYSERIKANTNEYEPNYALIAQQPSIAIWRYGMKAETEKELLNNMGYDGMESTVFDSGGTVFSDALLGVKRVLSSYNPDPELYTSTRLGPKVFESKYTLPFGMIIPENIDLDFERDFSLEYQNDLFKYVTGSNEFINISSADEYIDNSRPVKGKECDKILDAFIALALKDYSEDNSSVDSANTENIQTYKDDETGFYEYVLTVPIKGKETLYMEAPDSFEAGLFLKVNGEMRVFKSYLNEGEYVYPNTVINGIQSLGTYEDEDVNLIVYTSEENLKDVRFGLMDNYVLSEGIIKINDNNSIYTDVYKNGMTVKGNSETKGSVFLPVAYSENWHATVNGTKADVIPIINNAFVSVEVPQGEFEVVFTYIPHGLILGAIMTVIGLLLIVIYYFFIYKNKDKESEYRKSINMILLYGYKVIVSILFFVMYIIPLYVKLAL